ncbi:MAG TPA: hypothetical protein VGL65_02025 [Gemmatimonadales bacterium]|jgi:hypothetical protein
MERWHLAARVGVSLLRLPAAARAQAADRVIRHATIHTVDSAHPKAQAVAMRGDKIVYVGTDARHRRARDEPQLEGTRTAP